MSELKRSDYALFIQSKIDEALNKLTIYELKALFDGKAGKRVASETFNLLKEISKEASNTFTYEVNYDLEFWELVGNINSDKYSADVIDSDLTREYSGIRMVKAYVFTSKRELDKNGVLEEYSLRGLSLDPIAALEFIGRYGSNFFSLNSVWEKEGDFFSIFNNHLSDKKNYLSIMKHNDGKDKWAKGTTFVGFMYE